MKKIITAASLTTLGLAGLQAEAPFDTPLTRSHYAPQPSLTPLERAKPWSVSAALRGFYDDNYLTAPSDSDSKRESWGFEVSPSVGLNLPLERTFISANYTYSMRYFFDRDEDEIDQTHMANVVLNHAFTDTLKLDIKDSFVVSQEPEILQPTGAAIALPLRSEGSNLRNRGDITLTAQLTRSFSLAVGYANTFYDYDEDGAGSYSALLDRMEHLAHFDLRWLVQPDLTALVGYQYGQVDYSSEDSLIFGAPFSPATDPAIRDNENHFVYLGADYNFNNQLVASIRGGAQYRLYDSSYTDIYPTADEDDISPYGELNLTYTYQRGSYAQLGLRHAKNQTDVFAPTVTEVTQDTDTTTIYGVVNHWITPKLSANAIGQVQMARFNGGASDGDYDNLYLIGLNLAYQLNQFLGFELGYNFDRLDSDLQDRSFSRNRVYAGVRGTY